MKKTKQKINKYDKMLDEGLINDSIADQIILDLDSTISKLEQEIQKDIKDMNNEDFSDWDITLLDGLEEE